MKLNRRKFLGTMAAALVAAPTLVKHAGKEIVSSGPISGAIGGHDFQQAVDGTDPWKVYRIVWGRQ